MRESANKLSANNNQPSAKASTRRHFLQTSSAMLAGGAMAGSLAIGRSAHAAGSDILKVGLIGCGGRGSGAASNALNADPNIKIIAMADAFDDRLQASRARLAKIGGERFDVPDERCFVGFDAYRQLIDIKDIDVVLMATPPHFRPMQYRYAVEAGKHIFIEKPVGVDAPGIRSVMETNELAKKKGISVVSGLCWRYDHGVRETIKRLLDGAVGQIVAIQENYNTGTLWHRGHKPEWSEMEYQMRNWMYFTWLSGDHITEQHIHSLDKASWLMGDKPPVRATGLGGRQVRTGEQWGNIFDHHAVVYEYANGVKVFSYTRQQAGATSDVEDYVLGSKGSAKVLKNEIQGEKKWRFRGAKPNMYDVEHKELFASIRAGKPIFNGDYMATSSMLAIMGRMVTYTGKTLTWDQCINSKLDLSPAKYEWADLEMRPVAMPGKTPFV